MQRWWRSSHPATSPRTGRDWIVDSVAFLLSAGFGLIGHDSLLAGWLNYPHPLRVADLVFGVVACLGVFWRRRWPVQYGCFAAVIGVFSTLSAGTTFLAAFTVAVHRRWRPAIVVSVLMAASAVPSLAIYQTMDNATITDYLSTLLLVVVLTFAATGWGMFVRARRQLLESLRERAERAEADQHRYLERARRSERARIAREMHDVLAHRLSLLSVHAGALEFRPDAPPAEVARAAGVIRSQAHDALDELRAVITVPRDPVPPDGPERPQRSLADLAILADESRSAGAAVSLHLDADVDAVPAPIGRAVYRIAQEGLTNARKHANGAAVRVDVTGSLGDGVTVTVLSRLRVDRAAAPAMPGSGTGLVGLRERATLVGGRLDYGITDDGGFQLSAWLPWPA